MRYVDAHLVNKASDRSRTANIRLDSKEVDRLAAIQRKAVAALADLHKITQGCRQESDLPADCMIVPSVVEAPDPQAVLARIGKSEVIQSG